VGVVALAAGFALAYDKSAKFRSIINSLGPVLRVALEPGILLINSMILGLNLVIKWIDLVIKGYDALPGILRPTGKLGQIGTIGYVGGNLVGGNLLMGSGKKKSPTHTAREQAITRASEMRAQDGLPSQTASAQASTPTMEHTTRLYIDGRQAAEAVERYKLQLGARGRFAA